MASSKRSRRDPLKKAFNQGFNASIKGKGMGSCPYEHVDKRGAWMGGWRQANDTQYGTYLK
ncbi:MAG: ribosome modulation factor [Legionellales bacterium]|nr:ribosome modulation factor [Legionellales bacterium]|tara:strand:- start:58 stop:240 length:183 start_codon:yes stop_codon:yes gene_type:complete